MSVWTARELEARRAGIPMMGNTHRTVPLLGHLPLPDVTQDLGAHGPRPPLSTPSGRGECQEALSSRGCWVPCDQAPLQLGPHSVPGPHAAPPGTCASDPPEVSRVWKLRAIFTGTVSASHVRRQVSDSASLKLTYFLMIVVEAAD